MPSAVPQVPGEQTNARNGSADYEEHKASIPVVQASSETVTDILNPLSMAISSFSIGLNDENTQVNIPQN